MVTCRLSVTIYLAGYATSILVTVVTSTFWSVTAMEASTGTTGSTAAMLRPLRSSLSVGSSIERNQPCPSSLPSLLPSSEPFKLPLPPSLRSQPRKMVCWPGRQAGILVLHWYNKSTARFFFTHYTRKERHIDGRNDEKKKSCMMTAERTWCGEKPGALLFFRHDLVIMIIAVAVSMINFCMIFDE